MTLASRLKKYISSTSLARTISRNRSGCADTLLAFIEASSSGVLHIGAHDGREARRYHENGLEVLWVEANPAVYKRLAENIKDFPGQKAIQALLGADEKVREFFISSNDAESSSIYPFNPAYQVRNPELQMEKVLSLRSFPLTAFLRPRDASVYNHWVLDVQGAELDVLKGAEPLLSSCFSLKIEVSRGKVYDGAPGFSEIDRWLRKRGFDCPHHPAPQSHGDVVYLRVSQEAKLVA